MTITKVDSKTSESILSEARARQRLDVRGVVQGVGFRPFVYGLAVNLGLVGFVGNDSRGGFIEVEGPPSALSIFQQRLRSAAPPMAHVETISTQVLPPAKETKFSIIHSQAQAGDNTFISPDLVSPNDGGLALGQAMIAGCRLQTT